MIEVLKLCTFSREHVHQEQAIFLGLRIPSQLSISLFKVTVIFFSFFYQLFQVTNSVLSQ